MQYAEDDVFAIFGFTQMKLLLSKVSEFESAGITPTPGWVCRSGGGDWSCALYPSRSGASDFGWGSLTWLHSDCLANQRNSGVH